MMSGQDPLGQEKFHGFARVSNGSFPIMENYFYFFHCIFEVSLSAMNPQTKGTALAYDIIPDKKYLSSFHRALVPHSLP